MDNLKFELHFHTSEVSFCGRMPAAAGVRLIHRHGYGGLVVTDHYTPEYFATVEHLSWAKQIEHYLTGYRIAFDVGSKLGMVVLPGMEIRFAENNNDYLVYGMTRQFLLRNPRLYSLGIEKFSKVAASNGLLVYQAHPFRAGITRADVSYLHGIEGYNSHPEHNSHNQDALNYAAKHSLPVISGSDIHDRDHVGRSGVVFNEPVSDQQSLLKALRENKYRMIT